MRSEFGLNQTRGGWQNLIGRDRGAENEIDFFRVDPRTLDRFARRTDGELRSVFIRRGLPALFDAGPRRYPLVRRVDNLLQIGIRQDAFRIRMTRSENACVNF